MMQIGGVMIKNEALTGVEADFLRMEEEREIPTELSSIGEAGNRNRRIGVDHRHRLSGEVREEEKMFSSFKKKAEEKEKSLSSGKEILTEEILKGLTEEGISVEEADADLVEKSIRHIVENREFKREGTKRQAEELKKEREEIETISLSETADKDAVKRLRESGLPVTEENVERLTAAIEMAERGTDGIDDAVIKNMIEAGLSETPENIYKAGHQTFVIPKTVEMAKDVLWEEVKPQAEKLLLSQGVENTAEHETAAKWLFKKDLPIDEKNVASFLSLTGLKEEVGTEGGRERLKETLTRALSRGKDPKNAVIGRAFEIRGRFFLNRLRKVTGAEAEFQSLSARRNLEEIRLKLTEEVAVRMLEKGIRLEVTDLQGIVDSLRAEEEEYFHHLAALTKGEEGGAAERKEASFALFQSVTGIRSHFIEAGAESGYRFSAVTEVFKTEGKGSLSHFHQAGLAYEKGGTEIRPDLGDSIKKAFGNIDEVLQENGFSVTEANRKAVKLLSYSRTEINETSLLKMKEAALLTEEVMRELRPATVAGLVGEGINPLDMSMEALLSKAKELNRELKSEDERFSSFLYRLEKSEGLKEEEREAFIGIYRLLHQIEKSDGRAAGRVQADERALTLRNLLSAVRTEKLRGIDKKVDENFGELTSLFAEKKIDVQIEEAFRKLLAGSLKAELEKESEAYLKEKTEEIKNTLIRSTDIEKLMDEGTKVSLSNLSEEKDAGKGRRGIKRLFLSMSEEEKAEVTELSGRALSSLHDKERLSAEIEKLHGTFFRKTEELKNANTVNFREFKELSSAGKLFSLSISRMKSETYEIPVLYDGDRFLDFSVTLRAGKTEGDKGKLNLRIEAEDFTIEAEFRLRGERVTGLLRADHRESLALLEKGMEELNLKISESGFLPGEISCHLGKSASLIGSSDDIYREEIKTADIFRLTKTVSAHILKVAGVGDLR